MVELPVAPEAPPRAHALVVADDPGVLVATDDPDELAPVATDDPGALARGVLVGLGVSLPFWLGIVWLISWMAALPSMH
jgi:hypothetical protein